MKLSCLFIRWVVLKNACGTAKWYQLVKQHSITVSAFQHRVSTLQVSEGIYMLGTKCFITAMFRLTIHSQIQRLRFQTFLEVSRQSQHVETVISTLNPDTKRGSTTAPLTTCLTGLDQPVLQIKTKIVSCHTAVKQVVKSTVILPPPVFPESGPR